MRSTLAVALALTLSSAFALEARADPDQLEAPDRPFVIPLVEITSPFGCNLVPSDVLPLWTYRWQTLATSPPPDSVRFILVNTRDFNGSFTAAETYVRTNPSAPEWSAWQPYAPPHVGAHWTNPFSDVGNYVFAVHGKDREGNIDTEFTKTRNMRRINISTRQNGPQLKVTSPYFDPIVTESTSTPTKEIALVAGTIVDLCWSANAAAYCGVVEGYRYAWDIADPDDDSHWGTPFTPFANARECLAPGLVPASGSHTLSIEVIDHAGYKSRAQVKVTWHPAANPVRPWSRYYGDVVDQTAVCVAVDASDNVAIIGNFNGTIQLGGGLLVSGGGTDVFIAKFNAYGTHLWSRSAGGAGAQTARGIAMDDAGNVAVIGDFQNSMDFGGGMLTSAGNRDVFLAVYDADGGHRWSKRFGDAGIQYGRSAAFDGDGNIVITGDLDVGTIDFGGGGFRTGIYAAKFEPGGAHIWSKTFFATGGRGIGVALDPSGNLLLTGGLVGTANFGDGPETSAGGADIFVAKLDPDGVHFWNRHGGDPELQFGFNVVVDAAGNVAIAGSLFGQADLGGGPLVSAGGSDAFVAMFDADGTHLWSRRFGDESNQYGLGAAARSRGEIVITGYFAGATDFGGTPMTSAGGYDVFLARFDVSGMHLVSQQFGDALNQYGRSVVVDSGDEALLLGDFEGTIDVGTGPLVSAGARDVVLARLEFGWPVGVEDPAPTPAIGLRSYPNPFNPGTTIAYRLPKAGPVNISIFDVRGATVRALVNERRGAGPHETRWDGRNERGEMSPTGVYFVRLAFGNEVKTHKVVLLK